MSDWAHLMGRLLFGLLHHSRMMDDDDECGVVGRIIDRGNRSSRRKPIQVLLCPPQISHDLARARTQVAAVRSQRLPSWEILTFSHLSFLLFYLSSFKALHLHLHVNSFRGNHGLCNFVKGTVLSKQYLSSVFRIKVIRVRMRLIYLEIWK
jgi:hypothetical protein